MKFQTKLTLLLLLLSVAIIAGLALFSTISLDNYFRSRLISELTTQAHQAEFVVKSLSINDSTAYTYLQEYAQSANLRLTLIDGKGSVLFESELPREKLSSIENHLQRPEVQAATQHEFGIDVRLSATINIEMLYLAKKISHPFLQTNAFNSAAFVRVGIPLIQVNEVMKDIRSKIVIISVVVFLIVVGTTIVISKKIARPIKEMANIAEEIRSGNLEKRIPVQTSDEFGRLADSLNNMVGKLNEDITKLKKLERVRSEFLGNVSHELRTPIFAVQGMLETLLHGALEDKEVRRDFVERALANTQRLNTLLGDLIEISRIESGEMKLSFRYFQIHEFLMQVVSEMQQSAMPKNITLLLESEESSGEVFGDKERLKQVLVNLIQNAIKYTQPEGRITVSYKVGEKQARISVRDTGIGIPKEHLSRIFERFYRVDRERSRDAGGTGLGLAIVKHIVEAHGSNIEVQSEVGTGSTFSFLLKVS